MELLEHMIKNSFKDEDEGPKLNSEDNKALDNLLLKGLEEEDLFLKTNALSLENQCFMSF